MNWSIVHEEPAFVTCKSCEGRGYMTALAWGIDPDWCPECGGAKETALDLSALATLAKNLAIGAGLCRAFALGEYFERDTAVGGWRLDQRWAPGCGKAAP